MNTNAVFAFSVIGRALITYQHLIDASQQDSSSILFVLCVYQVG